MPPSVRPPSRSSSTHSRSLARSHALSDQEWPLNACFLACLLSWIGTRMDGSRTTSRWFRRRMICVCRPSESWTGRITPSTEEGRPTLHSSRVAARPPAPFSLRVGRLISFPLLDLLSSRRYFSVDIAFVIKFGRRIRPRSGAGQSVAGSDPCSDPPLAARNYIF